MGRIDAEIECSQLKTLGLVHKNQISVMIDILI